MSDKFFDDIMEEEEEEATITEKSWAEIVLEARTSFSISRTSRMTAVTVY